MPSLATSPVAPILGRHAPLRGPARLLINSYARRRHEPDDQSARNTTTEHGDVFAANLSSALEWTLWAFGSFEPHVAELFSLLVRPGDRCVDVGANIGLHTVRLAKLAGPGGGVTAIEPDPGLARRIERNLALNDLANVRVVNAAASDEAGRVTLHRPDPGDTNRARASLHGYSYLTGDAICVPAVTVDDVCGRDRVALIKIDVEGHEGAVARGAAGVIGRDQPSVVFEYAPALLDDPAQSPFRWLAEHGYVMLAVRPVRRPVTGRPRLALDRVSQPSPDCGDYAAVTPATAARLAVS
jgi:FkbM family methyltransferase